MRLMWLSACLIVAADCFEKAVGLSPQSLFSHDALWVWHVAAFFWVLAAVRTLLGDGQ